MVREAKGAPPPETLPGVPSPSVEVSTLSLLRVMIIEWELLLPRDDIIFIHQSRGPLQQWRRGIKRGIMIYDLTTFPSKI